MSHRAVEIDDRETIVVGGTIAALVLAAVYWVSRIGFESHATELLRSLGLSMLMLAGPYWMWRALRKKDSDFEWSRSQPLLTLAVVAFTALLATLAGPVAAGAGLACSVIGAVCAAVVLFSWLRNGAFRSRAVFIAGSVVISAWAAGVIWTSRYKMPLFWEVFSTTANIHHDPLYVTAMGRMLDAYGVPSTGLDGAPYTRYHYGSPWLFSRWADLVGTDVLSFYSLGYAVVMVPLFFASIAMLATSARKVSGLARPQGWLRSNWWGWLALAIGTIGIIPDTALYAMAVWNAHVFISESYLAGLPMFLMALAVSVVAWRGGRPGRAFLFLFLPVMLAALGFLKVSLMVLLLALVLYAAFRSGMWKDWRALAIPVMIAASYLTYEAVSLPAHNGGFVPLHFMRFSTAEGWHQFFPLIHFAWTWVYVAGRLFEERIADTAQLRAALRSRRLLDAELMLGLAVLGFLPGQILLIHGGSAIYFSDVQRWVALALVIARAGHWVSLWRERRGARVPHAGSIRIAAVLGVFIAAPFVVTMGLNAARPMARLVRQNLTLRSALVAQAGREAELAAGGRGLLFDAPTLDRGLEAGKYYRLISDLRDIGRLPDAVRGQMLLFIPQTYQTFWHAFDADDRCSYPGFIATSIAGLALLDGMPYYGCRVTDQYNMQAYRPRSSEQTATSDVALCERASALGFYRVMILPGNGARRVLSCRAESLKPTAR